MRVDIRPVSDDEFADFCRTDFAAFGFQADDRVIESYRPVFEADRSLAAFEGDRIVGTAGSFSFELTLPGGTAVPVAAVSYVGVLPTHRRSGVLSALMSCQIDDVHGRGEPLAVLHASEAVIYGRFGYGVATLAAEYEIDRSIAGFASGRAARPEAAAAASVDLIEPEKVVELVGPAYDAYRRTRVGELSRTEGWWRTSVGGIDPEQEGTRFFAVHRTEGGVDGYAAYRFKGDWADGLAAGKVTVTDLWAATSEAEEDLVRFVLSLDLARNVTFEARPLEDPLRWILADGRQLRTRRVGDALWVRPVDAAAVLASRRYRVEDRLGLALSDDLCPWNAGTLVVEGGPDGAACRVDPSAPADLAVGPAELGSLLLGGVRASTLAQAGRVVEVVSGAAARADRFLGWDPAPWCGTDF